VDNRKYIGMDVHQASISIAVSDAAGLIQGAGGIGSLTLVNSGTINANDPAANFSLTLGAPTTNTGLIEATNGGTLDLTAAIANAGGNITANGGTVNVATTITGGTLQIAPDSGATLVGGTSGLTISARYHLHRRQRFLSLCLGNHRQQRHHPVERGCRWGQLHH